MPGSKITLHEHGLLFNPHCLRSFVFQIATTTTNELVVDSSVYLSLRRSHGTFDTIAVSYEVSMITIEYVLTTTE